MTKKLITTFLLIAFNALLFAQADCVIFFSYKGVIVNDSNKTEKIGLPTTPFLIDYIKKNEDQAFAIYNINDSVFNFRLASHLSSDFCRTQEDIITCVFKKKKEYTIKLFRNRNDQKTKPKPIEIIIPLDSIKFSSGLVNDKKEIIIDFGHIKI